MLRTLLCVVGIVAIGFNANAEETISPTEYYELWRKAKDHPYVKQFFERKPDDSATDPEQYFSSLTGID